MSTSILTDILVFYHLATLCHAHTSTSLIGVSSSRLATFGMIMAEIGMIAAWAATAMAMLRPKGKDFKHLFDRPPIVTWTVAVALAFLQT